MCDHLRGGGPQAHEQVEGISQKASGLPCSQGRKGMSRDCVCQVPIRSPAPQQRVVALTDVMLLEQLVQAGQVLDDEVAQHPLVCLDTQQRGAEVGGREQVLDDGAHHPEGVLLLQKQQEAGGHLASTRDKGPQPRSPGKLEKALL